jgi:3-hydroxy-9,10-secoandrosta-1,3,5(10)-triene-9,17-dione monooxygenase
MSTKQQAAAPTREELLGRAWELLPKLRERAGKAEELRRLPEETERDFHDSGLFRALQPARIGGSELDFGMLVDMAAVIGRACGSSAWNLTNLASHHWTMAMYPPQAQDEIWGGAPDVLIASSFIFPCGKGRREKGGYVVSGRWPFSSGVDPCDWNMLAGTAPPENGDGPPEPMVFLLHRSEYEIIDTWQVSGLSGTGSKDVEAKEVFVPDHRALKVADVKGDRTPGSAVNPAPVYRLPMFAVFPYVLSGVALGLAEGAWDDHVGALRGKTSQYTGAKVGEFQAVQIHLAESSAAIDSARRIMQGNTAEAMAYAERGEIPPIEVKAKYRRDGAYSVGLCVDAIDRINRLSGGGGIYLRNPVQRAFRDVHALAAHIAFNMDVAGTTFGRVAVGLPSDNPTL